VTRRFEAGATAGLGLRAHGNQLGFGADARLAAELGAAFVDHCTFLSDDDIDALAAGDAVAHRDELHPRIQLARADAVILDCPSYTHISSTGRGCLWSRRS
jgi:imidazolonepropionase-like amidohydrolase